MSGWKHQLRTLNFSLRVSLGSCSRYSKSRPIAKIQSGCWLRLSWATTWWAKSAMIFYQTSPKSQSFMHLLTQRWCPRSKATSCTHSVRKYPTATSYTVAKLERLIGSTNLTSMVSWIMEKSSANNPKNQLRVCLANLSLCSYWSQIGNNSVAHLKSP
jgi:hypothetical protein